MCKLLKLCINKSSCFLRDVVPRVCCCVQFVCQEGHGDFLFSIDERETCSYVVTVHTSRICAHPLFGPPATVESLPISCNPLLSAADYEMYVKGMCQVISALRLFIFAMF